MKNIFFVKPDQFETARLMEKKLLDLPAASGILFVGVAVRPDEHQKPYYKVVVGCTREREPSAIELLVKHQLRELVKEAKQIQVEVYRGTTGSDETA